MRNEDIIGMLNHAQDEQEYLERNWHHVEYLH